MAGLDHREYYISKSVDELVSDSGRAHQAIWPSIEAVIRAHADWAYPIVIEGWALRPDAVAALVIPGLVSLWLLCTRELLEERIRADTDFYRGASDEEKMITRYLDSPKTSSRPTLHPDRPVLASQPTSAPGSSRAARLTPRASTRRRPCE